MLCHGSIIVALTWTPICKYMNSLKMYVLVPTKIVIFYLLFQGHCRKKVYIAAQGKFLKFSPKRYCPNY